MKKKKLLTERFQQLAGIIPLYEEAPENRDQMAGLLLKTLQQNKGKVENEISQKFGSKQKLNDFTIDDLGDVSSETIKLDDNMFSMGISFRLAADVDPEFEGEEGDPPMYFDLNGVKIAYIAYNI